MYDNRREMKYIGQGSAISRELEAISQDSKETTLENEHRVVENFNEGVFKSLKKILVKITKAS
jgi:hypothetical protein